MAASGGSPQISSGPSGPDGAEVPGIVAFSPAMQEVCQVIRRIADSHPPVLILGEPGVGKEEIAAAIHRLSRRRSGPLIRVDCGGVAADEQASELFGALCGALLGDSLGEPRIAERGALQEGAEESAEGRPGTLYLEHVERMPWALQTQLLRVLNEGTCQPVDDPHRRRVDARVIAASDCELVAEVAAGRFRQDLYWRLNVLPLEIPPLRSRREDVPGLVEKFLEVSNQRNGRRVSRVPRQTLDVLQAYAWPGNVHELQSYLERAVVMAEGDELGIQLLPEAVSGVAPIRSGGLSRFDVGSLTEEMVAQGIAAVSEDDPNPGLHSKIVDTVERELMLQVLRGCNGVRTQAAARLGINRNTLHKKMKEYGLDSESPEGAQ